MTTDKTPRPYRKVERARREEETRRRITEAAVELHGSLGPAQTSITDVAKLAGVSRMTVYNHFPTDVDLFVACSTHWAGRNPFPDPAGWAEIDDPQERLVHGLEELYRWYDRNQDMLGNVFRDLPILPALEEVMAGMWSSYVDGLVAILARGWPGRRPKALAASLRLCVDFGTWRLLTMSGLGSPRAAALMARLLTAGLGAPAASRPG